jgi:hypothetical protein
VGSKTNTSGAGCELKIATALPNAARTRKTLITWFLNALRDVMKTSAPLPALNSAGYDALWEFFHAICRILFDLAGNRDHARA